MNAFRPLVNFILHLFEETKTFAFIGKSGTGKSHRAKMIAEKYYIDLIIDDGLLIKGDKILAGFSAKQEANTLGAVRTAIFDTAVHRTDVINAIANENYPRILILGTSKKMVDKIATRLHLPLPCKYINIEDVATDDEISTAQKVRYGEGKHIIPVPAIEIARRYPNIAYGTSTSNETASLYTTTEAEKTVVTPMFSRVKTKLPTEEDLRRIIEECIAFYDNSIQITYFSAHTDENGADIVITVKIPESDDIMIDEKAEIHHIITDSLERYTNTKCKSVDIRVI